MSIMMREIAEQPKALERTLRAEKAHMLRVAARLQKHDIRLIVLVARGTSDNAALFGRYLLEMTSGVPVSMSAPSIDMKALARKLRSSQADSLIISSEPGILRYAGRAIKIPARVPELYSPIPYIIPGQIFAAMLAALKGLSPDRPRGLNKVTKTL